MKELAYLDERPVFEIDRIGAEAWATGGVDAEREARNAYLKKKDDAIRKNTEWTTAMREKNKKIKKEAMKKMFEEMRHKKANMMKRRDELKNKLANLSATEKSQKSLIEY